jgi:hypothetical protein
MSGELIRSLKLKNGEPHVNFDVGLSSDGAVVSSVFPGTGSAPVPPSVAFEDAIAALENGISAEYSLAVDWEWRLESIKFDWDEEEGAYGFSAVLSSFLPSLGKQKISIAQSSPSHVPRMVATAMETLEQEAIAFVRGASAQGSLFEEADDDEE